MEWMSPMDASFLHIEGPMNPMHIGGVSIFEGPAPPFERLAERLREAQVPDRGDDLAAFDEERAVAGQPGDDLGLGIEDAAVVELGHQQAPRDGAHHGRGYRLHPGVCRDIGR